MMDETRMMQMQMGMAGGAAAMGFDAKKAYGQVSATRCQPCATPFTHTRLNDCAFCVPPGSGEPAHYDAQARRRPR